LNLPVKATWDPETWTKTCLALITELQEPGTKPALPPASWASKTLAPPTAILRSEPPPGQLPWTLKLPINYFRFLGFGNGNSDKTCLVASANWDGEGSNRPCLSYLVSGRMPQALPHPYSYLGSGDFCCMESAPTSAAWLWASSDWTENN